MTTFLEQTSDPAQWRNSPGYDLGPSSEAGPAAAIGSVAEESASANLTGGNVAFIGAIQRNRRTALLTQVVEAEILPRLALARSAAASQSNATATPTTKDDTGELVRLLLGREPEGAVAFIDLLRRRGVTTASLYLGILTQAARLLGELWNDDRCDFTQVTISVGRLQQIVRALSPNFQVAAVNHPYPETVLLLPAPGEQHTFGLVILSEFFQREGWHVAGGPASTSADAADLVRDNWVDVAGFSIGSASRLEGLGGIIRTLRRVSRNRDISIMIGGPLFLLHPDLVARVGADVGARDAQSAVRQATSILALRTAAD